MQLMREALPRSEPLPADLVTYVEAVSGLWSAGIEVVEECVEGAVDAGAIPPTRTAEVYAVLFGYILAQDIACVAEGLNHHPHIPTLAEVLAIRRAAVAAFLAALDAELRTWDWGDFEGLEAWGPADAGEG